MTASYLRGEATKRICHFRLTADVEHMKALLRRGVRKLTFEKSAATDEEGEPWSESA